MNKTSQIGVSTIRKEAWDKVTGAAKYNGDIDRADMLHAKILTSPHSHAKIISVDTAEAYKSPGVQAIITGRDINNMLSGSVIEDRPIIASDKVRYFGEPVALVVANTEAEAKRAVGLIKIVYEQLEVVNSIDDAIKLQATLVHENLGQYTKAVDDVYPKAGSNICDHVKIRKGNIDYGFNISDIILESEFLLPQSDHLAMETRNSKVEILPNGDVIVYSSSQAPYSIRKKFSKYFSIPEGKIIVRVPLVGGAFGGKATVQLEYLAYLASKAVGGKMVKLVNSREEDIATSPCKVGSKAKLIIGASKDGMIKALNATYYVDCGAYTDTGPRMSKAMIVDSTGPYNIPYLWCDAYSIYTNHNYVTSFRGFGHAGFTFCIERMIDKLALALNIDPFKLRLQNSLQAGHTSPTQVFLNKSNMGDLDKCINRLQDLINWQEGQRIEQENGMIRAKGISCFWKTSDSPTNASSGAILTFNTDGSLNINFGGVEIGPGMKTTMCQILAEKMKMDVNRINVFMDVDTQVSPELWKTVASSTTFMVGNAVIKAANSLIKDLCEIGSVVLKCPASDLDVADEKVFMKDDPSINVGFIDIVHGYEYPDGNCVGGQIMATGSYVMKHLTPLDKETGKGVPGVSWTVGAQAVEIEYDPTMHTYRLLKAATVIDAGKVINPKTAKGLLMGGMSMGLGIAKCNTIKLDKDKLIIGAGVSLTEIAESNHYPLLSLVAKRIADHTIQGKITIGGNMAGTIIYKETLLPLLISQAEITLAGINGSKKILIGDFFHKDIKLSKGDLIVSIAINKEYLELPSIHIKRTKNDKIDYPLITIVAHLNKGKINIAFSGLCKYPFRSSEIEAVLNDDSYSVNERMVMAKKNIPSKVLGDLGGSAEYRKFMLGKMLEQLLQEFQEVR